MSKLQNRIEQFKTFRYRFAMFLALFLSFMFAGSGTAFAASQSCPGGSLFGFPKWYKYLNCTTAPNLNSTTGGKLYTPQLSNINDVWLIFAAVIEMLLYLAALSAVGFVIFGGIQYITSQGEPDKTTRARGTILNAIIGLVIAVISASVVSFIAGRFK